MFENGKIYMGLADTEPKERVYMLLNQSNRHGLIAGASGTGKTVTMKVMAESFSSAGVPVFMCDVKGDVSGMCEPGQDNAGMQKRIDKFGIRDSFRYRSYPTVFYDLYGRHGHPIRVTVSDIGPSLLSRILCLSEVQEAVLNVIFKIADEKGLKILDMKDLKAVISYVSEHRAEYSLQYGNMSAQSLSAITRSLIPLENEGAEIFFGEPMLDIRDWIRTDADGRGYINILHAAEIINTPRLYAIFLLWMMAELFETLPEVGDPEKPRLVFFFDEAHTLFKDQPKSLVAKIEQTVKLIRSKGVGIYFVTQSPSDIPDSVLAQLSNKVQHALRAYTPTEQKAIRAAAQSFRPNPAFKTEDVITQLGTGEAITSFLDEKGIPTIVQKTAIICPESSMSEAAASSKENAMRMSPVYGKYENAVDNESAFEVLEKQNAADAEREALEKEREELEKEKERLRKEKEKAEEAEAKRKEKEAAKKEAEAKKKSERRKAKIESSLISTGASVLRRGILGILKW
jgi:DNA helicase HerA-like ATPase